MRVTDEELLARALPALAKLGAATASQVSVHLRAVHGVSQDHRRLEPLLERAADWGLARVVREGPERHSKAGVARRSAVWECVDPVVPPTMFHPPPPPPPAEPDPVEVPDGAVFVPDFDGMVKRIVSGEAVGSLEIVALLTEIRDELTRIRKFDAGIYRNGRPPGPLFDRLETKV